MPASHPLLVAMLCDAAWLPATTWRRPPIHPPCPSSRSSAPPLQLAVAAKPAVASDAGVAGPASLFVEILNHYLYFFDHGCQLITTAVLQVRCGRACWVGRLWAQGRRVACWNTLLKPAGGLGCGRAFADRGRLLAPLPACLQSLLELVANEMSAGACKDNEALQTFYNNTLGHIRQQKGKGGEAAAKYDGLQV